MRIDRLAMAALLGSFLSMEDETSQATEAKTEVELEHVFYGRLTDFSALEKAASKVHQEQWTIKAESTDAMLYGGGVRARKITSADSEEPCYVICIKNFEKGKRGVLENEFEVSADAFEQIKRIAERGMIKTRYSFPIEGTDYCWEVDVFEGPNGPHEWVKVDLEVDSVDFEIPELPIVLEGLIRDNPAQRTEEQQRLISELQERYMTVANQYTVKEE